MTDEYGMTKLDAKFFKKAVIVLLCIAIIAVAVAVYRNNRWKFELDVKYVGYTDGYYPYYEYEITNNTNRTLKNVTVVIKIEDTIRGYKNETIEYTLGIFGTLKVGETETFKLHENVLNKDVDDLGHSYVFWRWDILRIVYD